MLDLQASGAIPAASDTPKMRGEPVSISTTDGACLAGLWFLPKRKPKATYVIHGATGLAQRYYRKFAAWLAQEQGCACLTYDYRDFAASLTGDIRRSKATFSDWGLRDQAAALSHAVERSPTGQVRVIGHSLGGLFLNRSPHNAAIESAVAIGSGDGNFLAVPPFLAPASFSFWFGYGPMLVLTHGYLPGALSGFGMDLPAGVFWEWRRWCSEPGFSARATPPAPRRQAGEKPFPITLLAVQDDALIRPDGVWRLGEERYADHPVTQKLLEPEAFELRRIGHMGAFTAEGAPIWPVLAAGPKRAKPATTRKRG
ncbi:MAG: alpha/beta fold hydrolase [Pseudomonadota bacterium]